MNQPLYESMNDLAKEPNALARINVERASNYVPLIESEPYFLSDALSAFNIFLEAHKVDTQEFAFDNLQEDLLLLNVGQPLPFSWESNGQLKDLCLSSGDALLVLSKTGPYKFSARGNGDLFVIQLPHDQISNRAQNSQEGTSESTRKSKGEYLKQFRNHGLYHLVLALFEIAKKSNADESESLMQIMQAIMSHLQVQIAAPDNENSSLIKPHDVSLVADYIVANPSQKINSKTLANVVGFSPAHMVRLFKRHYGLTPFRYWLAQRIERAKWLLERSEMPLSAIAKELVFEDQSHFTKVFCRSVGMTPNRYRRNSRTKYSSNNGNREAVQIYAVASQRHVQAVVTESSNQITDRLQQLLPSTSVQA